MVVGVNVKLEETDIGFGLLFNALGGSGGFAAAGPKMNEVRAKAAALPDDFAEFVEMAKRLRLARTK